MSEENYWTIKSGQNTSGVINYIGVKSPGVYYGETYDSPLIVTNNPLAADDPNYNPNDSWLSIRYFCKS